MDGVDVAANPLEAQARIGALPDVSGLYARLTSREHIEYFGQLRGLSKEQLAANVDGMAAQMLTSIGVEVSAGAVGAHYGARTAGGVLDGWLVDERDAGQLTGLEQSGLRAAAVPLMMSGADETAAMAAAAVALVADGTA